MYFVFYWNCQDFATWFLINLNIPLKFIRPNQTDRLTASGTDSSAQRVSSLPAWLNSVSSKTHQVGLQKRILCLAISFSKKKQQY